MLGHSLRSAIGCKWLREEEYLPSLTSSCRWSRKILERDQGSLIRGIVGREFLRGQSASYANDGGSKNDTVGCVPTRWDGLSLQDSRETPAVVPGARRRARICRNIPMDLQQEIRQDTYYTVRWRSSSYESLLQCTHTVRWSVLHPVKFHDKLPRGRGYVTRRGMKRFRGRFAEKRSHPPPSGSSLSLTLKQPGCTISTALQLTDWLNVSVGT